jgi:hypothetical protein
MKRANRSTYTPLDFISWREANSLELVPKFQRRGVWSTPARSFLIDTLIRGLPVPPIYLRVTQSKDRKRIVREVIDGQQRISSVLSFIDDEYPLSKSLRVPYAGKRYSELDNNKKKAIRTYDFICEVFHGISDSEVLEIFARLNTNSVPLNKQELRNGRFFGYFKQTAYRLALEYLQFWRRHRIFTEQSIARMLEVELTSELIIAQLDGLQDKKKSIDTFYRNYDGDFPHQKPVESRFRTVMDTIERVLGDSLKDSQFRKKPLFYSLFCVVYHRIFGLPGQEKIETPKRHLNKTEDRSLKDTTDKLSDILREFIEEKTPPPSTYESFVTASLRQTDNIRPRQTRFAVIYNEAFRAV